MTFDPLGVNECMRREKARKLRLHVCVNTLMVQLCSGSLFCQNNDCFLQFLSNNSNDKMFILLVFRSR